MQQTYGYVESAKQQLVTAGAALGVTVGVTGALGRRTVHQMDPKAQLVAHVAATHGVNGSDYSGSRGGGSAAAAAAGGSRGDWADALLDVSKLGLDDPELLQELKGMQDESDVFAAPQLEPLAPGTPEPALPRSGEAPPFPSAASSSGDMSSSAAGGGGEEGRVDGVGSRGMVAGHVALSGLEQALLLGWAAQVHKSHSQDELTVWQAAPYVEAVLQQRRSAFLLQVGVWQGA